MKSVVYMYVWGAVWSDHVRLVLARDTTAQVVS